jgi:Ice-binding-like
MKMNKHLLSLAVVSIATVAFFTGCNKNNIDPTVSVSTKGPKTTIQVSSSVPLGTASTFAVLGGETVTNAGLSVITGDLGVSPGSAITGFQNTTWQGPGTVTYGLGIVEGTIYAGGPVAAAAHMDAIIAYNYLMAQKPTTQYSDVVNELGNQTLTPGVYNYPSSAELSAGQTLTLDFQGNSDALFIFQTVSTLVTKAGSKVVAINTGNSDCLGSNVFWAVGSSATIDGDSFIGTVIAYTTITSAFIIDNTSDAVNVAGRLLALHGEVTMVNSIISTCGTVSKKGHEKPAGDWFTGGGWITDVVNSDKATFGVSGGIKHNNFWGQLEYNDHNGEQVKSTEVTNYTVLDTVTRQIDGIAKVNGVDGLFYTVVVSDLGEPGRADIFSIQLFDAQLKAADNLTGLFYTASGTLNGGNIQLHVK